MSKVLHGDNDGAKARAIPQVFSENSRAKNSFLQFSQLAFIFALFSFLTFSQKYHT